MAGFLACSLAGLMTGGVLNVLFVRLGPELSAPDGRLGCPHCLASLPAGIFLAPINWFVWRGRCPRCLKPWCFPYPVMEGLGALLAAGLWLRYPGSPLLWFYGPVAAALLLLALLDWHYYRLPDLITLPGLALALAASWVLPEPGCAAAFLGAAGGGFLLGGLRWLAGKFLPGGPDSLGLGDVKLLAFIGAALGWRALPWVLVVASVLGALAALLVILRRGWRGSGGSLPYGTYLAVGALSFLLLGR